MVRRIGKPFSPRVRSKCDQFLLQVDERSHTVHPGFLHGTIQNILGLSQVIDTRIVAPAIGSEDKGSDVIKFPIRSRSLRITYAVRPATPGKVTFQRTVLMLHVLFPPTPQAVEDVFPIKLHSNHHPVGHAFGTHIMIFDVTDVGHGITDLKYTLSGP